MYANVSLANYRQTDSITLLPATEIYVHSNCSIIYSTWKMLWQDLDLTELLKQGLGCGGTKRGWRLTEWRKVKEQRRVGKRCH